LRKKKLIYEENKYKITKKNKRINKTRVMKGGIVGLIFSFMLLFQHINAQSMPEEEDPAAVGAYNLIACSLANGLSRNATAARMKNGSFVIIVGNGPRNQTLETLMSRCYWAHGNSIAFSTVENLDYDGVPVWEYNVEHIMANPHLLTGIGRNTRSGPFTMGLTQTVVGLPTATAIYTAHDHLVERSTMDYNSMGLILSTIMVLGVVSFYSC